MYLKIWYSKYYKYYWKKMNEKSIQTSNKYKTNLNKLFAKKVFKFCCNQ